MIKFENTEVVGWEHAIRGMRNPMNSWEKGDSYYECNEYDKLSDDKNKTYLIDKYRIGSNDLDLMKRLRNAGTDHRKFMRMIVVYVDITAPLYWWKEFDTYKVGTVANSCSTMHKIAAKEFTFEDFSREHLIGSDPSIPISVKDRFSIVDGFDEAGDLEVVADQIIEYTILALNFYRNKYLETKDKKYWLQMIQLLPSSYNQKRTIMLNYEVLANIYKSRKDHKLDEWAETKLVGDHPSNMYPNKFTNGFCDWIKTLPYSELITGDFNKEEK